MKRVFTLFALIGITFLAGGCQVGQDNNVGLLQVGEEATVPQTKADEAKQITLSMDEVIEVKGVQHDKDIYIVPRVKQFDRFRLNGIRKEAHDHIKKRYPEANVHVSTDKKIFMEFEKLEQQLIKNQISEKELKDKVKDLEDKMKG
ncbi:YhcN/YlaJ family sporulation lipoprotein [Bacillus solitudinis]|uniref:YhcN/YlaJ family sporulation lipoprotein n=1 Tax=Bacillus solitudinis TaxID=2014074 RepID=UPI0012FE3454|nr:YhcN/YlaJ family sporulation lipoprotein [Bacillus solitudinis]